MRLTKRKTLQITHELWTWLAENPTIDGKWMYKFDWPGWERYGGMACDCPCCEYVEYYEDPFRCSKKCPLISLWPGTCTHYDSVFIKWVKSDREDHRTKYALIIANAAKTELNKLPKLKKELL